MANPFNKLNPANPMNTNNINAYRDIYRMLSNSGNPMQMLNQMASQNPNMKPIIDLIRSGRNPQDIFKDMCNQRGLNPDEFIKSITG